ncbi:hypothetical protein HMPREF1587_00668 [Bifidobacterium breve JCP7499]|nr:hypothetical protein HMPREF1587_00668 [Bifidobacterium breve JCP7499]
MLNIWPRSVSSRNLYCCAVLAGLPSRHKLSHYVVSPGQQLAISPPRFSPSAASSTVVLIIGLRHPQSPPT